MCAAGDRDVHLWGTGAGARRSARRSWRTDVLGYLPPSLLCTCEGTEVTCDNVSG